MIDLETFEHYRARNDLEVIQFETRLEDSQARVSYKLVVGVYEVSYYRATHAIVDDRLTIITLEKGTTISRSGDIEYSERIYVA